MPSKLETYAAKFSRIAANLNIITKTPIIMADNQAPKITLYWFVLQYPLSTTNDD